MELAADCTKMLSIKAMAVNNELPCDRAEQHPRKRESGGRAGDGEDETEDQYSITSVNSSLMEKLQQTGSRSDDKPGEELALQSLLVSPHPEDSLGSMGHHVSPLESIRELDEHSSELRRSPGDGAVKVREGVADTESPLSSAERNSRAGDSSGDGNALSGGGLASTFRSVITCDERSKLDNKMVELLKYQQSTSDDDHLLVESLKILSGEKREGNCSCSEIRDYHEVEGCNSLTEISQPDHGDRVESSLGNDLDTSATSLQDLQNLKLKHQVHQTEIDHLCTEMWSSKERIGELENELGSERKKGESQAHKIPELETQTPNSSLVAVLTECQSKVEQLEELKHSSLQLTVQLQAAQGMAACLQRRTRCLEKVHALKQQEVLELTEELEEARRVLREKSAEMARVTAQLHILQEGPETTQDNQACSTDVLANGHNTLQPHLQARRYSSDSKVCTLL